MNKFILSLFSIVLIAGCTLQQQTTNPESHRLSLKQTLGDPAEVTYILDGNQLGTGQNGYAALKVAIAGFAPKSKLTVANYYEGKAPYPAQDLYGYCQQHDIELLIPCAK